MTIKIILQTEASGNNYSLESGLADNIKNFDHHKEEHRHYPSPSNNAAITPIEDGVIEISHIDADTYIGLLRMCGQKIPDIDLNLVEQIDLNGSSICEDLYDETLLYMVGVSEFTRQIGFPRVREDVNIDVTDNIELMFGNSDSYYIELGRVSTDKSEESYKRSLVNKYNNIAIFFVDEKDNLDPSRPYKDGIDVVIVYRKHYETISIYANPKTDFSFAGATFANIEFNGHPKACGSPRGKQMLMSQAFDVFDAIRKEMYI